MSRREQRGNGAGSTGHVKQGGNAGMTSLEDLPDQRRLGGGISRYGIVVRGQYVVIRHHLSFGKCLEAGIIRGG
jgi:hypothetical protein